MQRQSIDGAELDRYITGNYGEDQFPPSYWKITGWDICQHADRGPYCTIEGDEEDCPRDGQCIRAIIEKESYNGPA